MAIKSRAELKARFQTNKIPTQDDFANVIESAINLADDGVRKSSGDPLSVKVEGATQEMLAFYENFESWPIPLWKINRKPGTNPGFNIATGDGTSRLFIDEKTGAINIGGTKPIRAAEPGMLQLGDDTVANNNGQLLLARQVDENRNHAYKIGVTDDCHLSIYDLGHVGNRAYTERLTIEHGGRISVKKGLEVNELLQANGDAVVTGKLDVTGPFETKGNASMSSATVTHRFEAMGDSLFRSGLAINGSLEANGNTTAKGEVNVYGLLNAKGNMEVAGTLDVKGDFNIAKGAKMKGGVIKWGDGTTTPEPGIYSTANGTSLKLATVNSAILFYNNRSDQTIGVDRPSMLIAANGNVGIGTDGPLVIEKTKVLQIGDDKIEGSGELIFGRKTGGNDRSYKIGINNDMSLSIGDYGFANNNSYTEYLSIQRVTGLVNIKSGVRIGVVNPVTITGSTLLQIGDDKVVGSCGELIFGMNRANVAHRSFKMGVNSQGYFSLGDYGNKDGKNYVEFFQIRHTGEVSIRKKLQVEGSLFVAGVPAELDLVTQGAYISCYNGETFFGNSSDNSHDGGFGFMNKNKDNQGRPLKVAFLSSTGDLYLKGNVKANNTTHVSDMRVKTNIRSSDAAQDLALLNKLRIADYDFLANGKRNEKQKGVIAQELEKLIPEAISHDKSFVADIFAEPAKITAVGKELLLTMAQPHHLINGDLVRFIFPNGETEHTVAVIDENSFCIEGDAEDFKDALVYGKQVDDFKRVNYHQLFLLNLSATQELSKKIDVLLTWKASLDKEMALAN